MKQRQLMVWMALLAACSGGSGGSDTGRFLGPHRAGGLLSPPAGDRRVLVDGSDCAAASWEITEPSNGYQSAFVLLASFMMSGSQR